MSTPFNEHLNTQLISREEDRITLGIDLQPHHLNRRGVAHGGVVMTLLDSSLGAAVIASMPSDWWCATVSLNVQFVRGAREGMISSVGEVVHRGASVAFARGEALDNQGRVIATAEGTWHLWPRKPGTGTRKRGRVQRAEGGMQRVGKVLAVGRNYADHIHEMGGDPSPEPVLFLKPPEAVVTGPELLLPRDRGAVHHEVELAVLLGADLEAADKTTANAAITGYAVALDLTLRDVQSEAKKSGRPWTEAKGFAGSAPVGAVTAADIIGDPGGREIKLVVDDEVRQCGNTSQMLHDVPTLLSLASHRMPLSAGDLILTGTPAGVGPLKPGQEIVATIEGLEPLRLRTV